MGWMKVDSHLQIRVLNTLLEDEGPRCSTNEAMPTAKMSQHL